LKLLGAAALAGACLSSTAAARSKSDQTDALPAISCDIHVYPADGPHSVGEDMDAVHRVDQDLRHYYEVAGHSLDWLTPNRQLSLLEDVPLASLVGVSQRQRTMHPQTLTRRQALEPGAREEATSCSVEIMLPQIMLERGGLATRSLRLFGVVRRYENGALVHGYSGFAAAPMTGFQIRGPADAPAATAIVEEAYRKAAETLLGNSAKPPRK
jgi:hypothetical protein